MAWNAYLSTLSHAPVLDTEGLLGVIDQAQGLLDSFLPPGVQVRSRAWGWRRSETPALLGAGWIVSSYASVWDLKLSLCVMRPGTCFCRVCSCYTLVLWQAARFYSLLPCNGCAGQSHAEADAEARFGAQDNLAAAFGNGGVTGHGLEGLKFDIPKTITLEPTRTLLDSILPNLPGIPSE